MSVARKSRNRRRLQIISTVGITSCHLLQSKHFSAAETDGARTIEIKLQIKVLYFSRFILEIKLQISEKTAK